MEEPDSKMNSQGVGDELVIPTIMTTSDVSPEEQSPNLRNESNAGNNNNYNDTKSDSKQISNTTSVATFSENLLAASNKELNTSCSSIENDTIYLLVSGKSFCISKTALMSFPNTKLGKLALRHNGNQGRIEYVFDRNSKIVAAILDFYRTGELHLPRNLCSLSIRRELRYWDIPDDLISECCYGRYKDALKEMSIVDELEKVTWSRAHPNPGSIQERVWNVMEKPGNSNLSWVWLGIYMSFILLSVILVCISTMRRYRVDRDIQDRGSNDGSIFDNLINTKLSTALSVFDVIGLLFFTIEPLVRLWASPSRGQHLQEFLNLLDLFLATDHWMCLILESSDTLMNRHRPARIAVTVFRSVLSLRVLRIFHLTRKNVKTKVLLLTFRASLTDILLLLLGLSMSVITFATLVYYAEMIYDTENFQNIPEGIWWAIITMTTVGYGDYYPTTFPGYVVGVACALCGLLLLSMPIAVTATNFNTYYCGLVAREQRQRRVEAIRNCQLLSFKKPPKDSNPESTIKHNETFTTDCGGDESKDEVFWFDDFNDFRYHYQSDGALNIPEKSGSFRSSSPTSLFHATSENSLYPRTHSSRLPLANHIGINGGVFCVDRLKPNHIHTRPKSKSRETIGQSSSIISQEQKDSFPNYNSICTDRNSNNTMSYQRTGKTDNEASDTKRRLDSVDRIRRRKKKYRARRKTRGSSINVSGSENNIHSDGNG